MQGPKPPTYPVQEALAQLEGTVEGGHMFLGHTLTLADVAIFSTLHPILATAQVRSTKQLENHLLHPLPLFPLH